MLLLLTSQVLGVRSQNSSILTSPTSVCSVTAWARARKGSGHQQWNTGRLGLNPRPHQQRRRLPAANNHCFNIRPQTFHVPSDIARKHLVSFRRRTKQVCHGNAEAVTVQRYDTQMYGYIDRYNVSASEDHGVVCNQRNNGPAASWVIRPVLNGTTYHLPSQTSKPTKSHTRDKCTGKLTKISIVITLVYCSRSLQLQGRRQSPVMSMEILMEILQKVYVQFKTPSRISLSPELLNLKCRSHTLAQGYILATWTMLLRQEKPNEMTKY